jgi:hypothetical protein
MSCRTKCEKFFPFREIYYRFVEDNFTQYWYVDFVLAADAGIPVGLPRKT